jgi:hypothetical protein
MLKTISAALLAASVIVAPAMAAGTVKTDVAPVTKSEKATPALGAKASMHKARHIRHAHHIRRHRTHAAAVKKHTVAHVVKAQSSVKRMSSAKPLAAKVKG